MKLTKTFFFEFILRTTSNTNTYISHGYVRKTFPTRRLFLQIDIG
jgi:hypothetical protein